jgi:hypothetical protein
MGMSRSFHAWAMLLLLPLAACQREEAARALSTADSKTPAAIAAPVTAAMPASATPTPAKPASTDGPAPLARYDGYGDLRFGMDEAEAAKAWGGELKPLPAASEPCHYLTPKWVKVPADFALMIEDGRFVRYDVGTDREAAPGGGRVGVTRAEIEQRYPNVEHRPHKYVEGAAVLRVVDPAGGKGVLVFETDVAGKVTAWRAGVAPQVDYVEGCS